MHSQTVYSYSYIDAFNFFLGAYNTLTYCINLYIYLLCYTYIILISQYADYERGMWDQ